MFETRECVITFGAPANGFYGFCDAGIAKGMAASCYMGFVDKVEAYRTEIFAVLVFEIVCVWT